MSFKTLRVITLAVAFSGAAFAAQAAGTEMRKEKMATTAAGMSHHKSTHKPMHKTSSMKSHRSMAMHKKRSMHKNSMMMKKPGGPGEMKGEGMKNPT
ncbi:hypothetical protein [Hansschlegelia plantiphila]|nr:hypothetical protein [Hansschlegelia plantiphila]